MSYNVLIVDDSVIIRTVLQRTLHIAGLDIGDVIHASDGVDALAKMEEHWIDLVFADINMPKMNGIEMIQQMKNLGYLAEIPVVVVTTERNVERVRELKQKGIKAYINKPFTPEEIRDVVNAIMGKIDEKSGGGESSDE